MCVRLVKFTTNCYCSNRIVNTNGHAAKRDRQERTVPASACNSAGTKNAGFIDDRIRLQLVVVVLERDLVRLLQLLVVRMCQVGVHHGLWRLDSHGFCELRVGVTIHDQKENQRSPIAKQRQPTNGNSLRTQSVCG